jgi:hypothetical protein
MIHDGLLTNQTPTFLWVSTDAGKLEDSLRQAAIQIVKGSAPEVLRDRQLLKIRGADLLTQLDSGDLPPIDQMEVIIRELESSGAALALDRPELLCDSGFAFDPSFALCDALAAGRIGCFIGLTNPAGMDRLRVAQPRLLMLADVFDLDNSHNYSHRSMVLHTSDPDELGWLVAVRCQLLAPAEALEKFGSDQLIGQARSPADLDELGIDRCWIVATDENITGIVISLSEETANIGDESKAERIALAGAQRLIQRTIKDGEKLEATRLFYLTSNPHAG